MAEVARTGRAGSVSQLEYQHIWKQSHLEVIRNRGRSVWCVRKIDNILEMTVKNLVTKSENGLAEEEKKKSPCDDPNAWVMLAYVQTDLVHPVSHSIHVTGLTIWLLTLYMYKHISPELRFGISQNLKSEKSEAIKLRIKEESPFWAHGGTQFPGHWELTCSCLTSSF